MSIEAMKQALNHAKKNERHLTVAETHYWCNQYKLLAEHFIAEAEKQEPVAWHESGAFGNVTTHKDWALANNWQPLYTHPQPKREPLTDEEKSNLWEISRTALPRYATYANLIEAAHGIKENT